MKIIQLVRCLAAAARCCVMISLLTSRLCGAPADELRVPTAEEFARLLSEQRQQIHSLKLTYESKLNYDPALRAAGRLDGFSVSERSTVAIKGDKRWSRTQKQELTGDPEPRMVNRTSLFDGKQCRIRDSGAFEVQSAKSTFSELNTYFNALLWPTTEVEIRDVQTMPPQECYFLPTFLEGGTWSSTLELLDGRQTVVFRNADHTRQLWVDPNRGFGLVKYQQEHPIIGVARWTFTYDDLQAVLPGIYLPQSVNCRHEFVDLESHRPMGAVTNTIRLVDVQVNTVPDSQFQLDPMPGETIIEHDKHVAYRYVPPTDQSLDSNIRIAKANQIVAFVPTGFRTVLIAINVLVILVLLSFFAGRALAKRRGLKSQ